MQGGGEDRAERRRDPVAGPREVRGVERRGQLERADTCAGGIERERDRAGARRRGLEPDRRPLGAERGGQHRRRGLERVAKPLGAEQQPRQLAREIGLAPALLELAGTGAGQLRDEPDRRGDRDERREPDPVASVGEREAPDRRQVEEVEGGGAEDRRADAEAEAPEDRDDDDREQVHDPERLDRGRVLEGVHEQRRQRDGAERDRDPERAGRTLRAQHPRRQRTHQPRLRRSSEPRGPRAGVLCVKRRSPAIQHATARDRPALRQARGRAPARPAAPRRSRRSRGTGASSSRYTAVGPIPRSPSGAWRVDQ